MQIARLKLSSPRYWETSRFVSYSVSLGARLSDQGDEQVIAPFLIVLRVANRTALTSEAIAPGGSSSIYFQGREASTGNSETLNGRDPMSSMETNGETLGELEAETATEEVIIIGHKEASKCCQLNSLDHEVD